MTTATYEPTMRILQKEPTTLPPATSAAHATPAAPVRRRSMGPVLAMVAGVVVLAIAAALTTTTLRSGSADRARAELAAPLSGAPADLAAISLSERDVSIVTQVYEPGHDSGWHSHPGIHAVAVVSGELTVYDAQCRPTTYGPGRPYVGGRELHLVRNEAAVPVEMSVTYLNPSAPTEATRRHAGPTGCVTPS